MKTLTVFTPAYNRAKTIVRTYQSLCAQTSKDFVWLIVDDGSSDNTRELVEGFIREDIIPIRYIYQQNQGMHGAHNTAYSNIDTELNVCIDSDDYMPNDAVEKIVSFWKHLDENQRKSYAGIVGLDVDTQGKLIGEAFPAGVKDVTTVEFNRYKACGDKKLVYRTEIVKKYPQYPLFEGERYVGLDYLYVSIDQDYRMLVLNEPLVIVDYQLDGSSFGMYRQYWNNPKGWCFYRTEMMKMKTSTWSYIFKQNIHYVSSCIRAGKWNVLRESPKPVYTLLACPFGVILYYYILHKVKKGALTKFQS